MVLISREDIPALAAKQAGQRVGSTAPGTLTLLSQ
jgi:hypothetical protein